MRAFLILIVSLNFSFSRASGLDSLKEKQDTTYIKSYVHDLIVKLDLDNDLLRFTLTGNDFKYDIRPNLRANRTLSFSYRWLYLGISYLPDFIVPNKWNERRGETDAFSIGGGFTSPRFVFDIQYVKVNGFYLNNTGEYVPGWNPDTDPYIQFPELKTWSIRGTAFYKTNPNFSIRAIQYQTEAQRKTCASLLPGLVYNYYVTDNYNPTASSSQRSNNLLWMARLGYFATFVLHKNWYASMGLGAGAGINHTWLLTRIAGASEKTTASDFAFRGSLNGGIGYNSDRFFAGSEIAFNESFVKEKGNIDLVFTRLSYQLFIGYRFNAPKFLKKSFDIIKI